jgi:tRNA(fMet)-specific endonuclease VapC
MGLMITQGYLLDTNIAIGMVDGEREILELISQAALHRKKIYVSVVTECELIVVWHLRMGWIWKSGNIYPEGRMLCLSDFSNLKVKLIHRAPTIRFGALYLL